ncbi:MAG: hypothetical protein RJB66_2452 [Pseudomonadota bacterium]|jgi:glycerol-3-phosphate dehydrogenase
MKTFSAKTRIENLQKLKDTEFDLLVVGGGILGAGIARDAASRGMKVALLEKSDFAWGTSSRSSKLVHGGIRYLENLEFGLVFEALNEREKLYELAPHLVHSLRFLLPIYENSRVGFFKMGMGMWLYDVLALFQSQLHESLDPQETSERMPWMKTDGLVGSFVYSDAYMDDDRLVTETLRSANELGATIVNYTKATKAITSPFGRVMGVVAKDELNAKSSPFEVRAKHVVSCVGPWTDEVAPSLDNSWKRSLRPTKGIHITLAKDRLPLKEAVVMAVDSENRIVFAIPRHEMIVIGTTDTDFKDSPDSVTANSADVKYVLKVANEYFPGAQLTSEDIIATYAGVRPLVEDGSQSEGKTSREHKIMTTENGVTFVMGGKYTTYRLIAEEATEQALKDFNREDQATFATNKTDLPLNPYCSPDNYHRALVMRDYWSQTYHLSAEDTSKLAFRHGMEAEEMLKHGYGQSLTRLEMELLHAIRNTMCLNLVDFYTRRCPLFLSEPDHGLSSLDVLGLLAQNELGWSNAELENQKQGVKKYIAQELSWQASKTQ